MAGFDDFWEVGSWFVGDEVRGSKEGAMGWGDGFV